MTGGERAVCANCGEAAGPRFCPHCGQELRPRLGPLLEVGREALSDWMSLDSRLLRSLRALARPGRLSELYLGGKRAPYLRPFRLYLIASVVLFSSLLALEAPEADSVNLYVGGQLVASESAEAPAQPGAGDKPASGGSSDEVTRTLELFKGQGSLGGWVHRIAGERIERLRRLPRQEILDRMISSFRRTVPSALILFVPFLALGLKLLYIRGRARGTLYLDHLVFSLHFQTALFLALSAAWLVARLASLEFGPRVIVYVATFLAMLGVYLPLALRRFYRQSWARTVVKTLILLWVYFQLLGAVVLSLWQLMIVRGL